MTRIAFTTSLVAFFSVAAVNYAAAQSAVECNKQYDSCRSNCNSKHNSLDERWVCQGGCEGGVQGCLTGAAAAADFRAKELMQKAIAERKKITCGPAQGNVQRCVQHGQDLMPTVRFTGGDALECNKQYDSCRSNCNSKYNSLDDRSVCQAGCEGGVKGCLTVAAAAAQTRAKDLQEKAIEERKKITCGPAQGNVQRCVQHGQDLK